MPDHSSTTGPPQAEGATTTAGLSDFAELAPSLPPSASRRGRGLRAAVLIGFVYLAMLATNIWSIVDARRHAVAQAQLGNTNLARAVSERVEASIAEVDHILDGLVYELEQSELEPEALQRLQPTMVHHVARGDQLKGLFVYDRHGYWIASSVPRWDSSANNADRAYFIHHRDNPSARPLVGAPLVSRSSGQWVVPVSRRINDAQGGFAGVALATLDLDHLRSVLDRFDLGEGAITLTTGDRFIARRPAFAAGELGQSAAAFNALQGPGNAGTGDARSPIDGVVRFFSFEQTRSYPVRVTVASSKAEVLGNWWISSSLQSLWVLLVCLALKRGTDYTRRALSERKRAETELRAAHGALAEMNRRLQHLAQFDKLTALPNRAYFDRRFERAFRHAQREQAPLAVVMVDVDEFKKYNDAYGHVEGDACLARVAAALRSVVRRPEDFAARYGGEEMVLLLRDTAAAGAASVAEAARQAVAELGIVHAASAHGRVSISVGVAARVPTAADVPSSLLNAADAALYEAKRAGRNRVQVARTA